MILLVLTVGPLTPTTHSPTTQMWRWSQFRQKYPLLCPTTYSKHKIEHGCVKHTDTPHLSPSTDKPPWYICGTTPSHAGRPTHLFLHCFRCQKFQNQFESPFTTMTLLQNLFLFNSLKAQPKIWKPSCIPLGLGLPFLNVWQGTCSFCVNHCCSVPDCLPASPGNSKGCTGVIRHNF